MVSVGIEEHEWDFPNLLRAGKGIAVRGDRQPLCLIIIFAFLGGEGGGVAIL